METVHGQRAVGDLTMQVDEDPSMVLVNTFVTCDSFVMPPHVVRGLPRPGTEVRVSERGWGRCPCCGLQQPQVRGGGMGVIECHASGKFALYVVGPGAYALGPCPDAS